jgi:hypothetical protein
LCNRQFAGWLYCAAFAARLEAAPFQNAESADSSRSLYFSEVDDAMPFLKTSGAKTPAENKRLWAVR